jgi:hypothetical protein
VIVVTLASPTPVTQDDLAALQDTVIVLGVLVLMLLTAVVLALLRHGA